MNNRANPINPAWPIILTFLVIMGWMPYEGFLPRVLAVGIVITLFWAFTFFRQDILRSFGPTQRLAVFGAMAGLAAPAVILGLMVLKTGVHAHGPEFTPAEISWTVQQFFIWPFVGGLVGFGSSFLGQSLSS